MSNILVWITRQTNEFVSKLHDIRKRYGKAHHSKGRDNRCWHGHKGSGDAVTEFCANFQEIPARANIVMVYILCAHVLHRVGTILFLWKTICHDNGCRKSLPKVTMYESSFSCMVLRKPYGMFSCKNVMIPCFCQKAIVMSIGYSAWLSCY